MTFKESQVLKTQFGHLLCIISICIASKRIRLNPDIINNISQIAHLEANKHELSRIIFAGGFVASNPYVWTRFAYAVEFWSKGTMRANFLSHDGYLGALGCLMSKLTPTDDAPDADTASGDGDGGAAKESPQ